jgi:hypothetical protein
VNAFFRRWWSTAALAVGAGTGFLYAQASVKRAASAAAAALFGAAVVRWIDTLKEIAAERARRAEAERAATERQELSAANDRKARIDDLDMVAQFLVSLRTSVLNHHDAVYIPQDGAMREAAIVKSLILHHAGILSTAQRGDLELWRSEGFRFGREGRRGAQWLDQWIAPVEAELARLQREVGTE